jgi:hypothetical protein
VSGQEDRRAASAPGFEDAADFGQPLPLERIGQVVEDEATDHHIEGLIAEGQLLHRLDPEINRHVAASGLLASAQPFQEWHPCRQLARLTRRGARPPA